MPAFPAAKWAIDIGCLSSEYIICSEDNDTKGIPDNRLCHIVGKLILGQHYKEQNFLFVTDVAAFLPIFSAPQIIWEENNVCSAPGASDISESEETHQQLHWKDFIYL